MPARPSDPAMPLDAAVFANAQTRLLELERAAELDAAAEARRACTEQERERAGVMLRRLAVEDTTVGLGGRLLVDLVNPRGPLPAHRFGPGDVVVLRAVRQEGGDAARDLAGVVVKVRAAALVVSIDDDDAELPSLVHLERSAPDVTHRRMVAAVRAIAAPVSGDAATLRKVLLGARAADPAPTPLAASIEFFASDLDPSQREAVAVAMRARDVALLHGPPGTGKTTTVVEVIRQAVHRGERVLACAPSNVAVDNLVERLGRAGLRVVRLGHPARILEAAREFTLDALVAASADQKVAKDIRRDLDAQQRRLRRAGFAERREVRATVRSLRRELRDQEDATVAAILDGADVVLATTTGAADRLLDDRRFDLAVIDEAAQALEAACWIPIHKARRVVLAGDHLQLAPTILSEAAARDGLARTLFLRLAENPLTAPALAMLTTQYRMHASIMGWSSDAFYAGRLVAAAHVRTHRLADLPGVETTADTVVPLLFLDTAGCGHDETQERDDASKANPGEAAIVKAHVQALLRAGVAAADIGVITPYNAQVQLLREHFAAHDDLEVRTVDGFQGREKEAIVLSLVRSNAEGEVGFLADHRRLNVAVTRARRHCALVGDSATLARDPVLGGLLSHCAAHGEHRSAWGME